MDLARWFEDLKKELPNKKWYAKIGWIAVLGLAGMILGIKYFFDIKQKEKAQLKNVLVEDDKKDIEYKDKQEILKDQAKSFLEEAQRLEDEAKTIAEKIRTVDNTAELDIINDIQSWEDVDKKIKE